MIKNIIFVISILFTISSAGHAERKQIAIGVILGLTGPAASFAQACKNGIELAYNSLPPEERARIKIIYEDDALESKKSVSAAQKLITINKVDALIAWSSGTGLSIAPIAEANKIPLIAIASDPAVKKDKKYTFIYWTTPEEEAATLLPCMTKQGHRKIGFVTLVHPGALAVRDGLKNLMSKSPEYNVVFDEEVIADSKDFLSVLAKIKSKKGEYDSIVPTLFPGQLALFLKQLKQSGITEPLYGFETYDDVTEIKASGGAMRGVIFATSARPEPWFLEKYSKAYPNISSYTADSGYDILNLLLKALASPSAVTFLETVKDYPGASGVSSSTNDHRFKLPSGLRRVNERDVVEDYICN